MKKMLKKVTSLESTLRFFDEDGNITDVSNLRGDVVWTRNDACEEINLTIE